MSFSVRAFRNKAVKHKRPFRRFLSGLANYPSRELDELVVIADKRVWKEMECLSCANCCKTMTPTYTPADIKRISSHLAMSPSAFKEKWLVKERSTGDWLNKSTPCQFLNKKDNKCSIYEVRPADCAGFPHLTKRKMTDYLHVHKQNVEHCPATFKLVEKMKELLEAGS
jgi:Fe-S-cluster containining protein